VDRYTIPKGKYIGSLLILSLTLLTRCFQQTANSRPDDVYEFPIQPGTAEWKNLSGREAMLAAVQLPDAVAESISTPGLVETIVNYPLSFELYVYSSLHQGFEGLKRDFNGINLLVQRRDAGTTLFTYYQRMDPVAISDTLKLSYVELLLAQPEIIAQFTPEEKVLIIQKMVENNTQREQLSESYSFTNLQTTMLLVGRILDHEEVFDSIDPRVAQFLATTTYDDDYEVLAISRIVFDHAEQYITAGK
jgi:hypothetical protein